jgi:hypothetical protein
LAELIFDTGQQERNNLMTYLGKRKRSNKEEVEDEEASEVEEKTGRNKDMRKNLTGLCVVKNFERISSSFVLTVFYF